MSILDEQIEQTSPSQQIKRRIAMSTKTSYERMVRDFNQGVSMVWEHPSLTPQEVCDALSTNAAEVFQLHGALGTLIANFKPEAVSDSMAKIGEFTSNPDGTVTIS